MTQPNEQSQCPVAAPSAISARRRPILGVSGLIIADEAILLIKRGHAPSAGKWSLPGGKVEWGEPLRNALAREMLEETGLKVSAGELLTVAEYIDREADGDVSYHAAIAIFPCALAPGEAATRTQAGDDAVEARWLPLAELKLFIMAGNALTQTTLRALSAVGLYPGR